MLANRLRSVVRVSNRLFSLQSTKQAIFNVQDENDFKKRVLDNSKPVVVDFHATWCGPCKILGPRLEKMLAEDQAVDFAKVDIDQLSDLAFQFNVQSVPTVIGFKQGKSVDKFIGLADENRIKTFVEKLKK